MDEKEERVAKAICKVELSSIPAMGDEICCQFAPASRRVMDGENNNVDDDLFDKCCWRDYVDTAKAAIKAMGDDDD